MMSYADYTAHIDAVSPGLRRRTTSAMSFDDEESVSPRTSITGASSLRSNHHNNETSTEGATFSLSRFLQFFILLGVCFLVYDRHDKVRDARSRLQLYREEEAALIGQMDRIEDRATELREKLKVLREEHEERLKLGDNENMTQAQQAQVQKEIVEWKKQYFEVNKDIHSLQDFMQDAARAAISDLYGEGSTLRVTLDLGFDTDIVFDLFEEAPHATYVFLQLLDSGYWSNAAFNWHPGHMVSASSTSKKPASPKLDFIEKNYHHHEAWTVGLTTSGEGYNMYVNLQDNAHVHEDDVCFGKIVSGYDSLRKLMDIETVAKQPDGEKAYLSSPVVIRSMKVSSVTRKRRYV